MALPPVTGGIAPQQKAGRARVTTHWELSNISLRLFLENGFDETTVDDIVKATGIGRRTFFRYFPTKNDLPWGNFDELLDTMRRHLATISNDLPIFDTLRDAVIDFNNFASDEISHHRARMWLILNTPSLNAYSTIKYAEWRNVIAEYVGRRIGQSVDAIGPQSVAWACLGLALSSYEQWLVDEESDLTQLIYGAYRATSEIFNVGTK